MDGRLTRCAAWQDWEPKCLGAEGNACALARDVMGPMRLQGQDRPAQAGGRAGGDYKCSLRL